MPDEMGSIDVVETLEIGGDRVTVFRQESEATRTATLVLRGATQNHLDDVERAVDDGVNVVKAITKDPRLVPGAGATEIELVERIQSVGEKTQGLAQYSIKKFGEAFEVVPRTLAESAGLDATEVLSRLYAAHQKDDDWSTGVDIEVCCSPSALSLLTTATNTYLRTRAAPALWMPRKRASSTSW
jgi:T-complex protein 1 subunit theta